MSVCPGGSTFLRLHSRGLPARPGFLGVTSRDAAGAHGLLPGQDRLRGCGSGTAVPAPRCCRAQPAAVRRRRGKFFFISVLHLFEQIKRALAC